MMMAPDVVVVVWPPPWLRVSAFDPDTPLASVESSSALHSSVVGWLAV